ncbi:MAG TPA: tetratricopeptide repeat protein [Candidatus Kapabacteria bacterium]|nr:tetratricopeptide repeat protein [Candidatus Kapabacteria bacterium]
MRITLVALFAATVFMALSGFECASTEMTTAKVALQQKDYAKAEASLKKEVAARPQNGQAWFMLGEIYKNEEKGKEMVDAYDKALAATDPALKPAEKETVYANRYNAWQDAYNAALNKLNAHEYQAALTKLDAAQAIRPDAADNLFLRAAVYRDMKNEDLETKANRDYISVVDQDAQRGVAAGLSLGMSRSQVEGKMGKPFKSLSDSTGGYGFYRDNELYVYYDGSGKVIGWRYYNGTSVPDLIREVPTELRSGPYYTLGVDSYYAGEKDRSRYDEALKYLQFVQRLDPSQEKVGQVIADIYGRTGRTDEAKRSFEASIRQNPNEPSLYINYGTLLVNMKDYEGAIQNFNKVLALTRSGDDKHSTALFNLGAAYKNWGADLQKAAGDKPSKAQLDAITGKLRESAKNFEQLRADNGGSDYVVLSELANLYLVLGEKSKFESALGDLERLKDKSDVASDPYYWQAMSRLYVIKGDTKKSEEAMKRSEDLRK